WLQSTWISLLASKFSFRPTLTHWTALPTVVSRRRFLPLRCDTNHVSASASRDLVSRKKSLYRGWARCLDLQQEEGPPVRIRTLAVVAATMLVSVVAIQPAHATPGAEDWVARLSTAGYPVDEVDGIAVSPDGARVFVAGTFGHFTGASIEVVAYDVAGTQLWSAHYRGSGPYDDEVGEIGVSPDGSRVYIAGSSSTDATKRDYIT